MHSALGAEGSYAASPSQTPLTPWRENAPSAPSTAASSAAQQQLAAAQRETVRLGWDLSVLKRDRPELEAAAVQSSRMLEASLSQQEMLIKGRAQGDANLEELRASLRQARAEAATLRQRNEQLEREVATLRQQGTAYGAGAASDARLPNLDEVPRTPLTRSSAARGGMLSPLSPLLVGLDESNANRSRGSAYWRRARMCLRRPVCERRRAASKGLDRRGEREHAVVQHEGGGQLERAREPVVADTAHGDAVDAQRHAALGQIRRHGRRHGRTALSRGSCRTPAAGR